jgi:hypothetical protein
MCSFLKTNINSPKFGAIFFFGKSYVLFLSRIRLDYCLGNSNGRPDHLYDKNRQAIAFPTGCFFRNGFVAGRKFHLLAEGRERVRVFDRLRRKDGHLVAVDLENKSEAQSKLSQHWPSHPPKKKGKKIFRVKYLAMVFYKMST